MSTAVDESRPAASALQPLPMLYQSNFAPAELRRRRERVAEAIGSDAVAVLKGAGRNVGAGLFRQTNELYYLTGIESPHAYLLVNGRERTSTLYLPHRDPQAERSEGRLLSAEDADEVSELTGIETVSGPEALAKDLSRFALRGSFTSLFSPFQPGESPAASRDQLLEVEAHEAADPFGGRPSAQGHFLGLLGERFPQLRLADLSPVLDQQRLVKSPRELDLLREAGRLTAAGISAAMRATRPGIMEYQLSAVARFVFQAGGARGDGYTPITAGGENAWHGHYSRQASPLRAGDLVLMDYAPDFAYYTSDIGRMWPVSGRFQKDQRLLYEFILEYHRTLLALIEPGASADAVMDEAAEHMASVLSRTRFERPSHTRAAEGALRFRGHLSHPVGMCVHDVGDYRAVPLREGVVFSVDPMLWVEDERRYVRVEDTVAVTADGIENFTEDALLDPDEIESAMADSRSGEHFALSLPPVPAPVP